MARTKAAARGRRGSRKSSTAESALEDLITATVADELDGDDDPEFDVDSDDESGTAIEPEADATLDADAIDDGDLDDDAFDSDDDGEDLSAAEKLLKNKQGSARELAIRRAIEERREARRLKEDLDYLDLDD